MPIRRLATAVAALALSASGILILPGQSTAATTVTTPTSIDATGATDVTAELQSFLDGVPDGSTVLLAGGGQYRIEGTLTLVGRNNLTIDGQGATTFATSTGALTRGQWKSYLGSNLTFRNLIVRGANPAGGVGEAAYVASLEAQHGMEFAGVDGVDIDHVTITDVYGDFVYLGAYIAATKTWTRNVKIHDSRFERNGRQGITFTATANVDIYRNYIGNTRRATLDLEPNGAGWGVSDVSFHDNTVGLGRLNFVSSVGSGPIDRVSITNNSIIGRAMQMTWWAPTNARRSGLTIVGNVANSGFGNSGGAAIGVVGWDRVTIKNNVQWLQSGRDVALVDVWESCEVDISGNVWTGGAAEGRIRDYACPFGSPTTLSTSTIPMPATTPQVPPIQAERPPSPAATSTPKRNPQAKRLDTTVRNFDVREPVRKGRWLKMSGRVLCDQSAIGWAGLAGERILIQFRPKKSARYRTVGAVRARWDGSVKVRKVVKAKRSGSWRLRLPASTALRSSVTKPDFVRVR